MYVRTNTLRYFSNLLSIPLTPPLFFFSSSEEDSDLLLRLDTFFLDEAGAADTAFANADTFCFTLFLFLPSEEADEDDEEEEEEDADSDLMDSREMDLLDAPEEAVILFLLCTAESAELLLLPVRMTMSYCSSECRTRSPLGARSRLPWRENTSPEVSGIEVILTYSMGAGRSCGLISGT